MKRYSGLIFVCFAMLFGMTLTTFGQTGDPNGNPSGDPNGNPADGNNRRTINERQHNQQKRIFNGVKDDELNRKEYFRLQKEQNQIRREERRYRNSGDKFTKAERLDVRRDLNKSSRHIYRAKHN